MADETEPSETEILAAFRAYFASLQEHPSAGEMMRAVLTDDFETGFVDGIRWRGPEGLAEFLARATASSTSTTRSTRSSRHGRSPTARSR